MTRGTFMLATLQRLRATSLCTGSERGASMVLRSARFDVASLAGSTATESYRVVPFRGAAIRSADGLPGSD